MESEGVRIQMGYAEGREHTSLERQRNGHISTLWTEKGDSHCVRASGHKRKRVSVYSFAV